MTTETSTTRMREQRAAGMTVNAIAADHNVSVSTVRRRTRDITPRRNTTARPVNGKATETAEMWRLWVSGMTQRDLAERYGIDQSTVSNRLAQYRASLPEDTRATILRRELDLLDDLRRRLLAVAYNQAEDTPIRLAAIDRVLKAQERLAKMLGLDAPVGVDMSATVRYEIAGVPADAHR